MTRVKITEKQCKICKEVKPVESYYRQGTGYAQYCKICFMTVYRWQLKAKYGKSKTKVIHDRIRQRGQKLGIDYMSHKEIKIWLKARPDKCYYCGKSLENGTRAKMNDLTMDRLNPQDGYISSNLVICCRRCNIIRGNWLTPDEMLEIAQKYNLGER